MKNTTFRKKALLSSVAMLLVALVALGSATFAWFTANPNAEASGLSLKTTAATGLVISTDSDPVWDHNALLNAKKTTVEGVNTYSENTDPVDLQPAAISLTDTKFYRTDAADAEEYFAAKDDKTGNYTLTEVAPAMSGSSVYAEKVYFKYSEGTDAEDGTVNLKSVSIIPYKNADQITATMAGCIRVTVAKSDGSIVGTYSVTGASANGTVTGTPSSGVITGTSVFSTGSTYLTTGAATFDTPIAVDKECSAVSKDADTEDNYVTVYVWLDGQDTNCYSDKVGTINAEKIVSDIQLNFTLAGV